MKFILRALPLAALITLASCAEDSDNAPLAPNINAVHDTVAMHTPPTSTTGQLFGVWRTRTTGGNYSYLSQEMFIEMGKYVYSTDVRVDGRRVWFQAVSKEWALKVVMNLHHNDSTLTGWQKWYMWGGETVGYFDYGQPTEVTFRPVQ